eukprot:scaffold704_cov347-Prasinococcus_capsulatus_cf.AAC.10
MASRDADSGGRRKTRASRGEGVHSLGAVSAVRGELGARNGSRFDGQALDWDPGRQSLGARPARQRPGSPCV